MVELAEDEMRKFGKVWASVFVSLSYCFIVGKITSPGFIRFIAVVPIIALFLALPLNLTSFHFCGLTSFFISWLANFKLLLFAFGKPPLCLNPPISFPCFLAAACLPIKIHKDPPPKNSLKSENNQNPDQKPENISYPSHQKTQNTPKSAWNYVIKGALLALILRIYDYSDNIPEKILWVIYFFHMYFAMEIISACLGMIAKLLLGFELEPPFNEPLLSTSLQDFWDRRWNIVVASILRSTVYFPVLGLSTPVVGRRSANFTAVMVMFLVSGLMHELIFYYVGRVRPTFEVTWFFLLHGLCFCLEEIAAMKHVKGRWRVSRRISGVAAMSFVVATWSWLFLPPLMRAGLDTRGIQEYARVGAFVARIGRDLRDNI